MRFFLSIFLLFTIVSSVVISVRQQIDTIAVCEFIENEEDKDDLNKESLVEKDLFTCKAPLIIRFKDWAVFNSIICNNTYVENLMCSLYRSLPYVPPK
jgi:hypothetical protein